ncbi:leucine-rich repeat serine/threonine-protein kinase 1-like isoform X2 [Clytia hemisphaerica]|uniref:leucine-rich repeat serine/threonine-protein kinase 1-like isoform X2 n=1 Tax=Clytia hemisphaerica TaxID=252671 RepID=UPI0034D56BCE
MTTKSPLQRTASAVDIHTDLVKACEEGDLNLLMSLSYNNQNVFSKLISGDLNYPHKSKYGSYKPGDYLFIACENNHSDVAAQLLIFGAENRPFGKLTPLLVCCKLGHLEALKILAPKKFPLHVDDMPLKDSPIFYCCRYGHTELLSYIIEEIPGILSRKSFGGLGECPKTRYIQEWSELTRIIKKEEEVVIGTMLLFIACLLEHRDMVEFLIKKGVGVNTSLSKNQFYDYLSPLSVACKTNNMEIIEFLWKNKAEITESIAIQNPEITGTLLERHTQPYTRTYSVKTVIKDKTPPIEFKSFYWDNLNLHKIHFSWLEAYGNKVARVDIHSNKLSSLPINFFELLPNLEDLDISCNTITKLPDDGVHDLRLTRIIACSNEITTIPLAFFLNPHISFMDFSKNKLLTLPSFSKDQSGTVSPNECFWDCRNLKVLKLSRNLLTDLPKAIHGAKGLEKLSLDENQFTSFETVWSCPLVELDISKNKLAQFSGMTKLVWSKSLIRLNLSRNSLRSISTSISHLQNLQYLDLSHNRISTLPPASNWKCSMLMKFDLSHNKFTGKSAYDGMAEKPFVSTCEFPAELFQHTLENLNLSDNDLQVFPDTICELTALQDLNLSRNHNLHTIPSTLGKLKNIWTLKLAELTIPELASFNLDDKNVAKDILPFLRAKLRKSESFNRMKLMIVGLQGRGKTTLLSVIQGKNLPENISTVGITVEQFTLPLKSKLPGFLVSNQKPGIKFSAWDSAGQQVYYATHQCFLTSQTLYLVVFNVTHGRQGIIDLEPWLANIQARAKNSRCIIVGTHTDCMPSENKKQTLAGYEKEIHTRYYKKKGFPDIEGYLFISSVSGEGVEGMRQMIYNVAESMNSGSNTLTGAPNRKMAPRSYINLYDEILKEKDRRAKNFIPPILTTDEMLQLADQNPEDNDIFTVEELVLATRFLHENGIVLHFDDHLHELNNIFFIDPSWLVDMFALVVTIPECNRYAQSGYIERKMLIQILSENPRLPENFLPQYLRLLERFEIALCLDVQTQFLIPAMLPSDRPELTEQLERYIEIELANDSKHYCLNRTYHMSYIPAGFWSRLIARLMIAVQKWGMQISDEPTSETENYEHKVWREGVMVTYDDGFYLVESFHDETQYPAWSNKGVSITVWSLEQDFSVMGFIVDHLDMLITEWYPGLEDVDNNGDCLVQKLITCPMCRKNRQDVLQNEIIGFRPINRYDTEYSHYFRDVQHVNQFYLLTCASAAISYKAILCEKHPQQYVDLSLVVPDLMLTDLPPYFVIDPGRFMFAPSEETRLGVGGAGGVYKGGYKECQVAVKQFHSTTKAKQFDTSMAEERDETDGISNVFKPTPQSTQEQLEDTKIIQAFWELRQEVSMLCRLQHANIIQFIGVCHSPLCFVIELAPQGSLQGILEKKQQQRDEHSDGLVSDSHMYGSILGRFISYKIAFQVIDALYYLHDSEIVYRDLKSDNVLVWSLDPNDVINIKLSDYGIATFSTPQGVIGEGGTHGFQAPEVRFSSPYDEKVDIFSFGIWLYELLSGYRPFRTFRTGSEMKKAILRGVRPNLRQDFINSDLPFLECIMEDCWQQNPNSRPSSQELAMCLKQPDVCMLQNIYPPSDVLTLQKVRVAIPWTRSEKSAKEEEILIWSEYGADRRYQLIDIRNDKPSNNNNNREKILAGPRILCACQVENHVWLGNEGCQIEVFGQLSNQQRPSILWKFSLAKLKYALDMKTYQHDGILKVFASLVDGHLCIFTKDLHSTSNSRPIFDETEEDIVQFEKDKWDVQDLNLGTRGYPAKCMSLTRNNTELWVGSGSLIVIVDPHSNTIKEHIETTIRTNRLISLMTSDEFDNMWTCERGMSFVTQWDVASRTKLWEFQCNIENPVDRVLVCENTGHRSDSVTSVDEVFVESINNAKKDETEVIAEILDLKPVPPRSRTISITKPDKIRRISDGLFGTSPTKGKSKDDKARSKSDDAPLSSSPKKSHFAKEENFLKDLVKPDGFVKRSLVKKPSLMHPTNGRSTRKKQEQVHAELLSNSLPRQRTGNVVTGKPVRVTGLVYAKDALWVGRNNGDILVIAMKNTEQVSNGTVLAVLGGLQVRSLGGTSRTITSLSRISEDRMLALVKFDNKTNTKSPRLLRTSESAPAFENYQLLKYDIKSTDEIVQFKSRQVLNHS